MKTSLVLLLLFLPVAAAEDDFGALVRALGSPLPEARSQAAARLREAGAEAVPALREGLGSGDLLVVLKCAELVHDGAYREARSDLRRILAAEGSPALLVRACCRTLGRVGDYRDVEILGGLLPGVAEAALALAEIGEPEGIEPLAAALGQAGAPPAVAYALAALGDLSGVPSLIAALDMAPDRSLPAVLYLRRIAGRDAGTSRSDWDIWWRRDCLARALGDPDWEATERSFAEILGRRDDPEAVGDLLAIATDTAALRDARTKAIMALGRIQSPEFTKPLLDLLNDDAEPLVRLYAAEALGRIGEPAVAVDLAWYLIFDEEPFRKLSLKEETGPYVTIDSEVCKALVRMGVKGGLDFMIRQLEGYHRIRVCHEAMLTLRTATGTRMEFRPDARREDRMAAARRWRHWFDETREELVLPTEFDLSNPRFLARVRELVDTLGHYKFLTMSRARETLVLLGETAFDELVAGLARPEFHIRTHCAEILGRIRARRARGALAHALEDRKPEVRTAAVAALAEMGAGDQALAVIGALADPAVGVRIEAARALARVDAGRARAALEGALARKVNNLPAFKREAYFALAAHGDAAAVDRLVGLLSLSSEGIAFLREVGSRVERLTGMNPGVDQASLTTWRDWWKVNRESYTPAGFNGKPR